MTKKQTKNKKAPKTKKKLTIAKTKLNSKNTPKGTKKLAAKKAPVKKKPPNLLVREILQNCHKLLKVMTVMGFDILFITRWNLLRKPRICPTIFLHEFSKVGVLILYLKLNYTHQLQY